MKEIEKDSFFEIFLDDDRIIIVFKDHSNNIIPEGKTLKSIQKRWELKNEIILELERIFQSNFKLLKRMDTMYFFEAPEDFLSKYS